MRGLKSSDLIGNYGPWTIDRNRFAIGSTFHKEGPFACLLRYRDRQIDRH